jgi:hypothetical protein
MNTSHNMQAYPLTLTPPKWVAAQNKTELEDRLGHFIDWLDSRGVWLFSGEQKDHLLDSAEILSLIEEYV